MSNFRWSCWPHFFKIIFKYGLCVPWRSQNVFFHAVILFLAKRITPSTFLEHDHKANRKFSKHQNQGFIRRFQTNFCSIFEIVVDLSFPYMKEENRVVSEISPNSQPAENGKALTVFRGLGIGGINWPPDFRASAIIRLEYRMVPIFLLGRCKE